MANPARQPGGGDRDPGDYRADRDPQCAQDRAGGGVPVSGVVTEQPEQPARSGNPAAAIRARGVTRDFPAGQSTIRVLHGIDTDIRSGEMTYVVGESGSGKTTLISIMCGILWPTDGEVEVFGTDIYRLSDTELVNFRLNNIGFIFQQYNLIPSIDAAANAAVPLIAQGMAVGAAREKAKVLLDKLNIGDQADKLPKQLSGGQQQRVAIARALVHEPRLVVCDEPTAALDARSGRRVMDLLREVAVAPDRACIIVTHDNRIFDLADRILVLEDGRITHDGTEMPQEG
nr:ABC transporter ATP-binding protein [Allopontixanthobacter sediminis]